MRLNRFVALATGVSRRAADVLITAGHVTVDQRPAGLGTVLTTQSTVKLDGQIITIPTTFHYLAVHKPAGYVSSRRQQGSEPVVYDLLPTSLHALRLAGRLDLESSGLILLSDDGEFIQRMSHPSADKLKLYEVDVERALRPDDKAKLEAGVRLADGISRLMVRQANGRHLKLALAEGRNRQIRRTLGALGYTVTRLHRTKIGPYELGDLAPGQWREFQL